MSYLTEMRISFRSLLFLVLYFPLLLGLRSCTTDTQEWQGNIHGKAQKGPFINGSSVTIFELNDTYNQTGRVFGAEIGDNSGSFSLDGVGVSSSVIQLRTNGFYFNEVCGVQSQAQITLNGIVDASQTGSFNLNVLTHIEKERVKELISQGNSFADAKVQAQANLLSVFGFNTTTGLSNSEMLDMAGNSEGDAVLIALSCIFQGYRNESSLSSTLADFITDFKPDGDIDDVALVEDLVLHAQNLKLLEIRSNLESRYDDLGINVSIPDFETYIGQFLNSHPVIINRSIIDYPQDGGYGANFLDFNRIVFAGHTDYSFTANMPSPCMDVTIEISRISGPECNPACWYLYPSSNQNWVKETYNSDNHKQRFRSDGINCDLRFKMNPGTVRFDYYEGGDTIPTHSKIVEITG